MGTEPVAEDRPVTAQQVSQPAGPGPDVVCVHHPGSDAADSLNFVPLLTALVVLVGLIAVMFYVLPTWLPPSSVNIIIRN